MKRTFARMHNEYLDADRHNDTEQPVQLHDDKTLISIGKRGHGLNGKNADLDSIGQNVVNEAWWFANGTIQVSGERYANICPPEDESKQEDAQGIIWGTDYPGEWSDDYWTMSEKYSLTVPCEWNDAETDEQNTSRAVETTLVAISKDSLAFETEMASLNRMMGEL